MSLLSEELEVQWELGSLEFSHIWEVGGSVRVRRGWRRSDAADDSGDGDDVMAAK